MSMHQGGAYLNAQCVHNKYAPEAVVFRTCSWSILDLNITSDDSCSRSIISGQNLTEATWFMVITALQVTVVGNLFTTAGQKRFVVFLSQAAPTTYAKVHIMFIHIIFFLWWHGKLHKNFSQAVGCPPLLYTITFHKSMKTDTSVILYSFFLIC